MYSRKKVCCKHRFTVEKAERASGGGGNATANHTMQTVLVRSMVCRCICGVCTVKLLPNST